MTLRTQLVIKEGGGDGVYEGGPGDTGQSEINTRTGALPSLV